MHKKPLKLVFPEKNNGWGSISFMCFQNMEMFSLYFLNKNFVLKKTFPKNKHWVFKLYTLRIRRRKGLLDHVLPTLWPQMRIFAAFYYLIFMYEAEWESSSSSIQPRQRCLPTCGYKCLPAHVLFSVDSNFSLPGQYPIPVVPTPVLMAFLLPFKFLISSYNTKICDYFFTFLVIEPKTMPET